MLPLRLVRAVVPHVRVPLVRLLRRGQPLRRGLPRVRRVPYVRVLHPRLLVGVLQSMHALERVL